MIPYRFIGEDGSMGLEHGQVYILELRSEVSYPPKYTGKILAVIYYEDKSGIAWKCPYKDWKAFSKNWEKV